MRSLRDSLFHSRMHAVALSLHSRARMQTCWALTQAHPVDRIVRFGRLSASFFVVSPFPHASAFLVQLCLAAFACSPYMCLVVHASAISLTSAVSSHTCIMLLCSWVASQWLVQVYMIPCSNECSIHAVFKQYLCGVHAVFKQYSDSVSCSTGTELMRYSCSTNA